jgi:hypothetical protein
MSNQSQIITFSACVPLKQDSAVSTQPKVITVTSDSEYNTLTIIALSESDVRYAKKALTEIGYQIG